MRAGAGLFDFLSVDQHFAREDECLALRDWARPRSSSNLSSRIFKSHFPVRLPVQTPDPKSCY